MEESDHAQRLTLLERLRFALNESVDFTQTDLESTLAKVRLLTAAATYFNILTVSEFGGRLGPAREQALVEQVIGAAFQAFAGNDPHPEPFDKAAMLLRGITQGHPFHDGNKRTGFLTAMYFLARVGYDLNPDLDQLEVIEFCRQVSAGDVRDVGEMARALELWSVSRGGSDSQT